MPRGEPTAGRIRSLVSRALKILAVPVLAIGAIILYNALRHVVFWSPTESVTFESADGVRLAGTLIKPDDEGVFPAVVVLHGSGPEDIYEPSYRAVANTIVRSGLAVLLYDKRGVGDSSGDFGTALYRDFVADAVAAVNYLAGRADIDAGRIGLHGTSESGWLTPEIAHRSGRVAFVFNRVGAPLSWRDTVIWEVRNDLLAGGVARDDLEPLLEITMRSWNYYVDTAADPGLAEGLERDAIDSELKRLLAEIPAAASEMRGQLIPYDPETYEAWAADIGYDPGPFLMAIDVPMMYAFGETDVNVPTAESAAFLEAFRNEHEKDIDFVVFEGVGHPMVHWRGLFSAGYVPEFLELIRTWYPEQAQLPQASCSPPSSAPAPAAKPRSPSVAVQTSRDSCIEPHAMTALADRAAPAAGCGTVRTGRLFGLPVARPVSIAQEAGAETGAAVDDGVDGVDEGLEEVGNGLEDVGDGGAGS